MPGDVPCWCCTAIGAVVEHNVCGSRCATVTLEVVLTVMKRTVPSAGMVCVRGECLGLHQLISPMCQHTAIVTALHVQFMRQQLCIAPTPQARACIDSPVA
jgi:hypothetical protein